MAAIKASFVFTPAVPGVTNSLPLTVEGETLSAIKAGVRAALETKRNAAQGQVDAINAADTALDG